MTNPTAQAEACAEMLKALRTRELTAVEVAEETGVGIKTVYKWCYALEAHGILEMGTRASGLLGGAPPTVFRVSSRWGGAVDAASR